MRPHNAAAPICGISRHTKLADLPELLTVPEAAAFLGLSEWAVYQNARTGNLPCVRIGRVLRIPRGGLSAMITGPTATADTTPSPTSSNLTRTRAPRGRR
jgi:excisionase family DNA binding protein